MDCFQDFCLACDKQCSEGSYCSQRCRLADLEKSSNLASSSPPWKISSGYVLAPAYGFPSPTEKKSSPHSHAPKKALTPSSSRTSLSSTGSSSSDGSHLTEKARAELQEYYRSFDQTRAAKRRSSTR